MTVRLIHADCRTALAALEPGSVHCCVTSPPYFGLRDYGHAGQMGLEATPAAYVEELVSVFRLVRRVLRDDGTVWLNLGDSYAGGETIGRNDAGRDFTGGGGNTLKGGNPGPQGMRARSMEHKAKDLLGVPWLVAFALRADGWFLRQDIIWHKPNPMPESVTDRCTKAHEYLFLLSKSPRYYFDAAAIAEKASDTPGAAAWRKVFDPAKQAKERAMRSQGAKAGNNGAGPARFGETRNKRSVWTVASEPFAEAHFACFPPALIEPAILAGCPPGGTVLDPFSGAGTTGLVADRLQRNAILIELNSEYASMAEARIHRDAPLFVNIAAE